MKFELSPLPLIDGHKFFMGQSVLVEGREHLGLGNVYGACFRNESCPACELGWWYFIKFPGIEGLHYYPESIIRVHQKGYL